MGSKQDDHNRGERDGSKASGFDAWVDLNNPLNPEEYKAGYRHGLQQQRESSASIGTSNRPRLDDEGGGGGGGGGGRRRRWWREAFYLVEVDVDVP